MCAGAPYWYVCGFGRVRGGVWCVFQATACCRQALLQITAVCFVIDNIAVFVVIVIAAGLLVIAFIVIIVANTINNVLFCDINVFQLHVFSRSHHFCYCRWLLLLLCYISFFVPANCSCTRCCRAYALQRLLLQFFYVVVVASYCRDCHKSKRIRTTNGTFDNCRRLVRIWASM